MYCIYRSPFWKSTTDVGTKNPWQHAVAPIPVTSRCGLLELACSIALYVLHVLGYSNISSCNLGMKSHLPGQSQLRFGGGTYTDPDWP
jgi:hypothetical protein